LERQIEIIVESAQTKGRDCLVSERPPRLVKDETDPKECTIFGNPSDQS
jgi:hypothetical protein